MNEQRISRRQLLERISLVGAAVALAPIAAACSNAGAGATPGASASSAPSAAATPSATAAAIASAPASEAASAEPTPEPTPEDKLFIYNWDQYIGDTTIDDFQKKYGIEVHYDKFPDAATQMTKVRSDGKGGGYDVTYPASTEIPGLVRDGVIQAIKKDLVPNAVNLGPEWANPGYDPGNQYSMPNYWWTTGFVWNPDKVDGELTSWQSLWDDRYSGHLGMLDDYQEVFAVAAFRLKFDPNTTDEAQLDQSLALLEQQKPLLRKYTEDDIGDFTRGTLWMTHAWSGDYYQMLSDKPKTRYVIPSEGAIRGSDTMVVLSGAAHPIAANLWIDFNLDAQVSANNSNYIGYMGPNAAAQAFIDPAILGDPAINPSKAVIDQLTELIQLEGANLDKYTTRWTTLTS
jgi:spermidine/putrescine transport system substrate-binding protein